MAANKISALTATTTIADADEFPVVSSGQTKKITGTNMRAQIIAAPVTANAQTASYTLVLADAGKVVEMNVASANNLTVPTNAAVAFPVGSVVEVIQYGAGQTTIVAAGGVTINSPGGKLNLTEQYSVCSLRKRATNEWVAIGDLST